MAEKPLMLIIWDFVKTLTFRGKEFGQLRIILFNILYRAVSTKELKGDDLERLRFICQYLDYYSIQLIEKFLIERNVRIYGRIW